jgi:hypothetical protein
VLTRVTETYKGREDEEKDVSSYLIDLRKSDNTGILKEEGLARTL